MNSNVLPKISLKESSSLIEFHFTFHLLFHPLLDFVTDQEFQVTLLEIKPSHPISDRLCETPHRDQQLFPYLFLVFKF